MDPDDCPHPGTPEPVDDGYACRVCGRVFPTADLPDLNPPAPRHPGPAREASLRSAAQAAIAEGRAATARARETNPDHQET